MPIRYRRHRVGGSRIGNKWLCKVRNTFTINIFRFCWPSYEWLKGNEMFISLLWAWMPPNGRACNKHMLCRCPKQFQKCVTIWISNENSSASIADIDELCSFHSCVSYMICFNFNRRHLHFWKRYRVLSLSWWWNNGSAWCLKPLTKYQFPQTKKQRNVVSHS